MNVRKIKPQTNRIALFLLAHAVLFLFSCATSRFNNIAFDHAYNDQNYELCIKMLENKDYGEENTVLKNIDLGVISHYAKNFEQSAYHFNESDRLIDSGDLRSVAQFESFYLNILNALNYYRLNKLEDAAAEIKKADDEKIRLGRENSSSLWFITDHSANVSLIRGYDSDEELSEEDQEAYRKFGISPAEVNEGAPRKPTYADLYQGSPSAYFLGALLRNANGDPEGARLDKDYLKVLNPTIQLTPALKPQEGMAALNIIAFSGKIAEKIEEEIYFPPEYNGIPQFIPGITIPIDGTPFSLPPIRFRIVYPKAGENITRIDAVEAVITDTITGKTDTYPLNLLEDFGENLKKNVALRARKEYQRNAAKNIAGKLTAAITTSAAIFAGRKAVEAAGDSIGAAFAQGALLIAEASLPAALEAANSAMKADIRQAKYLPARSSSLCVPIAPGMYDVRIRYLNNGMPVREEVFYAVDVKAQGLNLLESICLD
ncbi:MAG: hypothetical protein ACTTH8_04185 [Treponema sp.]